MLQLELTELIIVYIHTQTHTGTHAYAYTNMKELGRLAQTEHVREATAYALLPWDLPQAGGRGRLGIICMCVGNPRV